MKHAKKVDRPLAPVVVAIVVVALAALLVWLVGFSGLMKPKTQDGGGVEAAPVVEQVETKAEIPVRYVAVIGADTWREKNGAFHLEGSDLQMVMRIDQQNGKISLLSVPRDTYYELTDLFGGNPGETCPCSICKGVTYHKANYAFHYGFYRVWDGSNYEEAVASGAEKCTELLSAFTGIEISDYALVDLYTFQHIVDVFGALTVDVPLPINNYTFYSGEAAVTIEKGVQDLDSWEAMVAARARVPYTKLEQSDDLEPEYSLLAFDGALQQDDVRQFVNRRMLVKLMDLGLTWGDSQLLQDLVDMKLIYTNLSMTDIASWYDGIKEKAGSITVHAAAVNSWAGQVVYFENRKQWLLTYDAQNYAAVSKEFQAGESMTSGHSIEDVTI